MGHQVLWLSVSVEILMGEVCLINPMPGGYLFLENSA